MATKRSLALHSHHDHGVFGLTVRGGNMCGTQKRKFSFFDVTANITPGSGRRLAVHCKFGQQEE
jgi:hypothetical protein